MGARLEHLTEKFLGIQEYSFSDVTASFSTFIYSHTHRDTHRQTDRHRSGDESQPLEWLDGK